MQTQLTGGLLFLYLYLRYSISDDMQPPIYVLSQIVSARYYLVALKAFTVSARYILYCECLDSTTVV